MINFSIDLGTMGLLAGALTPAAVVAIGFWWDKRGRARTERSPQKEKLLRPPGHTLSKQLNDTSDALLTKVCVACGACAMAGLLIVSAVKVLVSGASGAWIIGSFSVAVAVLLLGVYWISRLFKCVKDMRCLRLGLRGEQAVAEALTEVADVGFRSFHDFPGGDNWNIDHIVVGPRGVFAVETKAFTRKQKHGGPPAHKVKVERDKLVFSWSDNVDAIPQAKRNARDLAIYLTKKSGEKVWVDWLVVLPGYFIEADKDNAAHVMNARYLIAFLRQQQERIPAAQVRRIVAAVEEKCRDVEF